PAVQEPRTHPGGAGRDRGPAAALIASAPAPAAIGAIAGERLSRQTYPREGGGQPVESPPGGMPERTKGHAWRACRRATASGVQIPVPPRSLQTGVGRDLLARSPKRRATLGDPFAPDVRAAVRAERPAFGEDSEPPGRAAVWARPGLGLTLSEVGLRGLALMQRSNRAAQHREGPAGGRAEGVAQLAEPQESLAADVLATGGARAAHVA